MPNQHNQEEFDEACDILAELIVEAIEASLRRSRGKEAHPATRTEGDLIASLSKRLDTLPDEEKQRFELR